MDNQQHLISPRLSVEQSKLEPPIKLGVMASGNGSNFEALVQAIAAGKLQAVIPLLVYNNPGAKVAARAQLWGVPAILLNHRNFSRREDLDRKIVQTFQEAGVELIVMAGWMRVVTQVLIEAFPGKIVNIHPSLLPSFKGIQAVEQALSANVKITGCTAHLVSLEVDSGKILLQAAVPVLPNDTPETLHKRIQVQEHLILPQAIAIATQESRKREYN